MDRKISDEQIDRLAANLLKNFAVDTDALDEIDASPQLWQKIKNGIDEEKTRREKSWFAVFRSPVLAFGAAAIVVCFALAAFFLNDGRNANPPVAERNSVRQTAQEVAGNTPKNSLNEDSLTAQKSENNPAPEEAAVRNAAPKARLAAKKQRNEKPLKQTVKSPAREIAPSAAVAETKTDFIALTYAGGAESGQILRVKVPSSMMVSLGLRTNVEKESEMVNAEVVVGSDGTARAIRFIR